MISAHRIPNAALRDFMVNALFAADEQLRSASNSVSLDRMKPMGIVIDLAPSEWVDVTAAHIAASELARGRK